MSGATRETPYRATLQRHCYPKLVKSGATLIKQAFGLGLTFAIGLLVWRSPVQSQEPENIRRDATVKAVEKVLPTIVNIQTEILVERRDFYNDLLWDFFGPYYRKSPTRSPYSLGSGVIIDDAGYVLTNTHVIQRADRIEVVLQDGRKFEAQPFAGDEQSDVALLRILAEEGTEFPAVNFAQPDDLLLGETVIALGNPFGLGSSISKGILSSKNRRPEVEGMPLDVADWLQTDAAINPGNSGGPLINLNGDMIGLNVAVYKDAQGIGFAIPMKRVTEALGEIFMPEFLSGLWFGAQIDAGKEPLTVSAVQSGAPADDAGLRSGDRILAVNGTPVKNIIDYFNELTKSGAKHNVELSLLRNGSPHTAVVQLKPEESHFNADLIRERTGMTLQPLTQELRTYFSLRGVYGFIVANVDPNSPASRARIQESFIITGFEGRPLQSITEAAKLIESVPGGQTITLRTLVHRQMGAILSWRKLDIPLTLN